MRSGSPAHDGDGWPPAQNPYRDDTLNGAGPHGPGRRGEPQEGRGVPFGPDISWPNGFRQIDPEARYLLESGYGRSQYDRLDPGYGTGGYPAGGYPTGGYGTGGYGAGPAGGGSGTGGYGSGPAGGGYGAGPAGGGSAYREPGASPAEDFGYGDPGYSDPSYDGPGRGSGFGAGGPGRGGVAGYRAPDYREPSRPESGYQPGFGPVGYPVTGSQEVLPATGPQPVADWGSRRDSGHPQGGYPEQWYDHPRMVDSRGTDPRGADLRGGAPRAAGPRASDPRLEGIRYDELRYDDSPADGSRYDEPRYDEPMDDESWVAELRRSAPAYPQLPGGDPRRGDPPRGGDQPRVSGDARGSGRGQQPGSGAQPGSGSQPGYPQASGYGQGPGGPAGPRGRDDRGGGSGPMTSRGPRMSTAPDTGPASRTSAFRRDLAVQGEAYLVSKTQVGVLSLPATRRLENPVDSGPMPAVSAAASHTLGSPVRPGHGLDGPEITSSWPAQPSSDAEELELEAFEEFWSEDDDDDYPGLFPDQGRGSRRPRRPRTEVSGRRIGRRRGRSSDHRLWLALVGVVVVAGAAIFGILKFEFPSAGGPVHEMVTPSKIGSYTRTMGLERQDDVNALRAEVIKMSSGQASDVKSAVYESGAAAAGSTEQIVMFIGGHLANAAPATSIASFTQKFPGASVVSAGTLGGQAACVEEASGTSDSVAMCVWFDNDSFGEFVSPTMNANSLAVVMRAMRPSVELVVPK